MGCGTSNEAKDAYSLNCLTVEGLENILHKYYGYTGSLKSTAFSSSTNIAFKQLTELLRNATVNKSDNYSNTVKNENNSSQISKDIVPATKHDKFAKTTKQNLSDFYIPDELNPVSNDTVPEIGDIAFVYWHGYGWFTAKIIDWLPDKLSYLIKWTDGNWAPELALYNNLCVDKIPDSSTIGVGTKVLFKQGLYYCGHNDDGTVCDATGRSLSEKKKQEIAQKGQISDRWHMGVITDISKDGSGRTVYNGKHVDNDDPQSSKNNYVDYNRRFQHLKLEDLRTIPNIYNCLDTPNSMANFKDEICDIFLSKVSQDNHDVNRIAHYFAKKYRVSKSTEEETTQGLQKTVGCIKTCKVYLVCLSDNFILSEQAMAELLYAKKTLGKPVIPLVLGESSKWSETTAGMLLAGQLYIQFKSFEIYEEKITELENNLEKLVITDGTTSTKQVQVKEVESTTQPKIFLSYCWSNSKSSYDLEQVQDYTGSSFSDPRQIKKDLEKRLGQNIWLDTDQLDSVDDSGMFGQIAQGLKSSSVVVLCVSKEYINSKNCQMEANFALHSLHKDAVLLEVGSGTNDDRQKWQQSSIGTFLLKEELFVITPDCVNDNETYKQILDKISERLSNIFLLKNTVDKEESALRASVPMVGDSVIAFYDEWQFYPAKVSGFDKKTLTYIVDWEDSDPNGRYQPYHLVAVNQTPDENEIGIGTSVLFQQGTYRYGLYID